MEAVFCKELNIVELMPFQPKDIDTVFAIQQAAYAPLYEKYQDHNTSPYAESKETVLRKYTAPNTVGYLFVQEGIAVGTVRVHFSPEKSTARISALGVLPQYQGQGIAQKALMGIERLHKDVKSWTLDTILQEAGNCHLYEKLGYRRLPKTEELQENMTIVFYEKP